MEPKTKLLLIAVSYFTMCYLVFYWASIKLNNFTYERVNATVQQCEVGELLVTFWFDGENQTATVYADPMECEFLLGVRGTFAVLLIDDRIIEVAAEGYSFKITAPIVEAVDHMLFGVSLAAFILAMVDPRTRKLMWWCCEEKDHGFVD